MRTRTDLALEVRESFPEDHVEIQGVSLKEKFYLGKRIRITTVDICNEQGSRQMGKPEGTYVTMEFQPERFAETREERDRLYEVAAQKLADILENMEEGIADTQREPLILLAGLGNRFATPDALGPYVMEKIPVNRHIVQVFGRDSMPKKGRMVCGITPGVMGQTGMETREILGGIIEKLAPSYAIVIDALASRSITRLCRTIQITDTGISPGSGIGNNRNALNRETLKVPVIAIGVPTVVEASTIVAECMEETLSAQGYQEEEIQLFLRGVKQIENLFVTPKDIDEQLRDIGEIVARGIVSFAKLS